MKAFDAEARTERGFRHRSTLGAHAPHICRPGRDEGQTGKILRRIEGDELRYTAAHRMGDDLDRAVRRQDRRAQVARVAFEVVTPGRAIR